MRVADDAGAELNATFSVEPDEGRLAVVLESSGGRTAGGGRARNSDYRPALEVLLSRLVDLHAVLVDAVVDSRNVRHLTAEERRVLRGPVRLDRRVDVVDLRHRLTSGQGRIGQPEGALKPGNNSKRLRLLLDVPGYRVADARREIGRSHG
ncbi:hypothetical protein AB0G02_21735 [Actinosynnema sp. NPDC023658]|uniref:hypothetical protein n=1 Tax=Actinosynnema sp. NPDC023658 TaxID=3155465 RepID=UPI0033CC8F91